MPVGVYSVVRFSDSLRDERVNLGVVVWHPDQGYAIKLPLALDRAKAIDPALDVADIRSQIKYLRQELENDGKDGRATLERLSDVLRDGFELTAPYPTRLAGKDDCADHLFQLLVTRGRADASDEMPAVAVLDRFTTGLREVVHRLDPTSVVQDLGERYIQNVRVKIGLKTNVGNHAWLWRVLPLNTSGPQQIVRAKAASLDLLKIRGLAEYGGFIQKVAVQAPKKPRGEFDEARTVLSERADVIVFRNAGDFESVVEKEFLKAA